MKTDKLVDGIFAVLALVFLVISIYFRIQVNAQFDYLTERGLFTSLMLIFAGLTMTRVESWTIVPRICGIVLLALGSLLLLLTILNL
jgi:hypothetical protein